MKGMLVFAAYGRDKMCYLNSVPPQGRNDLLQGAADDNGHIVRHKVHGLHDGVGEESIGAEKGVDGGLKAFTLHANLLQRHLCYSFFDLISFVCTLMKIQYIDEKKSILQKMLRITTTATTTTILIPILDE